MYFYFNDTIGHFLFEGINITGWDGLAPAMVVIAIVAILIEIIKSLMTFVRRKMTANPLTESSSTNPAVNSHSPLLASLRIPPTVEHIKRRRLQLHIANSFLHIFEVVIGYLLMLAIMTYNAYIFLSVLLGLGIGYLFFGAYREGFSQPSTSFQEPNRRTLDSDEEGMDRSGSDMHSRSYGSLDT
ncbi:protein SLC31A2-like isoform X2 [Ptychodera flava]